jgi:hypothetical protein
MDIFIEILVLPLVLILIIRLLLRFTNFQKYIARKLGNTRAILSPLNLTNIHI